MSCFLEAELGGFVIHESRYTRDFRVCFRQLLDTVIQEEWLPCSPTSQVNSCVQNLTVTIPNIFWRKHLPSVVSQWTQSHFFAYVSDLSSGPTREAKVSRFHGRHFLRIFLWIVVVAKKSSGTFTDEPVYKCSSYLINQPAKSRSPAGHQSLTKCSFLLHRLPRPLQVEVPWTEEDPGIWTTRNPENRLQSESAPSVVCVKERICEKVCKLSFPSECFMQ